VHVGDVSGSQLVIGDHNTIQTPKGVRVTLLEIGERPVPRLRALPLAHRPPVPGELFGRDAELAVAAGAAPQSPVQVYGPVGIGKTALLKAVANGRLDAPEGVVFETARRRDLDEILSCLYSACWECEVPFVPTPALVGGFLADRDAVVVLDDCGLDRDDLDVLIDTIPRCRLVIGSQQRSLWSRGRAEPLRGLELAAGVRLLERKLGQVFIDRDRAAAEGLVRALEGNPQRLVEAAALIGSGEAPLSAMARALEQIDTQSLTAAQKRILALLALLDGAALSSTHVSAITDLPSAPEQLVQLERHGWVKSDSPRYRLVRPLAEADAGQLRDELTGCLLAHLTRFAQAEARPAAVVEASEAIEAALGLAARSERWPEAISLARASEQKLAQGGAWKSWRRVLAVGLEAARALGDPTAEAHMLHQLGSLAICLDQPREAAAQLHEALRIREQLGDKQGAELTRHNLGQLSAGGPGSTGGGPVPRGPRGPYRARLLAILAIIAAAVVAVIVLTRGGPAGGAPKITISQPVDGATYPAGRVVHADYSCFASRSAKLTSCRGTVPNGAPLDTAVGTHTFEVIATDQRGRSAAARVTYSVSRAQTDTTPPALTISAPSPSGQYTKDSVVKAQYACAEESGGSGIASCDGTVANGRPVDMSTPGQHQFTVSTVDKAGNRSSKTIAYTVVAPDTTAPAITISVPEPHLQYPEGSSVAADYNCTDESGGSGVTSCDGPVASGQPIDTSTPGSHRFTVTATDKASNTSRRTVPYTVTPADKTAPTITITAPSPSVFYAEGATVAASYSCQDEPQGSGLASCEGTVSNGAPIDTSTAGQHTFQVTATDKARNSSTQTVTYTVTLPIP